MNYLRELWGFRNVRHRVTGLPTGPSRPVPRSRAAAPARPVSIPPPPQQQPRSSSPAGSEAAPPAIVAQQPPQQPPRGASLGFAIYATNRDIFDKSRIPVKGAIFYPFRIGASPYPPTHRSAAFSRNFLFLFFLFWHTESNP